MADVAVGIPGLDWAKGGLVARWRAALGGGLILAIVGGAAVMAPVLAPYGAEVADPSAILVAPDAKHLFGTDTNGMDVLSRVMWGGRLDLSIALIAACVSFGVGSVVGGAIGYAGTRGRLVRLCGSAALRVLEVVQAFPVFVLALALVGVAGRSTTNLTLVLSVVQIPLFIRLSRSAVLTTSVGEFLEASRCAGASERAMFFRHILPNSLSSSVAMISPVAGSSLLLAAGLSFVGAGVPAPTPEWGYMVSVGAPNLYTGQWWPALIPGATIGLTILGFALVGRSIEAFMDPARR